MFRKQVAEVKQHFTDRVVVDVETGRTEVSDGVLFYPGILGDARTWLMDATANGEACYKDHQQLLVDLGELFTKGTPEEIRASEESLERAGFLIGFERDTNRVTISHASTIMSSIIQTH